MHVPSGPGATGNAMQPGEVLLPNASLHSSGGLYTFVMQGDGNLVLYKGPTPLWSSNTAGQPIAVCIMQADGNLVLYDTGSTARWNSNTAGHPGGHLIVQDDGNVVIYAPAGQSLWATNTVQPGPPVIPTGPTATGNQMQPGQALRPGDTVQSDSGLYSFAMQGDGNLVLYKGPTPLWSSDTAGQPIAICIMQGDGNLVLYNTSANVAWDSNTAGNAGSHLIVQDDGNVVIYAPAGQSLWATNTVQPGPPVIPTGPTATGNQLQPGQVLHPGDNLQSDGGLYSFAMQGDGNLVLYKGPTPLWSSSTAGQPIAVCIMQGDGNLVLYNTSANVAWDSNTAGTAGSHLIVQDDGNVVIYAPAGQSLWATNTVQPGPPVIPTGPTATGNWMQSGQVLHPGDKLQSTSGKYTFAMQGDGNLVLYKGSTHLWSSNTAGQPIAVCIMQGDGNLVLYNTSANVGWASNTAGNPNSHLTLQDDGNAVIYSPAAEPVWATNTAANFALAFAPSTVGIKAGSNMEVSLQATVLSGQPDAIVVKNTGPQSPSVSWDLSDNTSLTAPETYSADAFANKNALAGSYLISIEGTSGAVTKVATLAINVLAPPPPPPSITLPGIDKDPGNYSLAESSSGIIASLQVSLATPPSGVSMSFDITHTPSQGTPITVNNLQGNTSTSVFNGLDVAGQWKASANVQQPPSGPDYTPTSLTLLLTYK